MQWNCPHCGTYLAVSEEVIGTGWSFSKCYQCGGSALIRKAETNVIKVDRVPANERVILPEAASHPVRALLSENATRRLEQHLKLPPKTDRPSGIPSPGPTLSIGPSSGPQPKPAPPEPRAPLQATPPPKPQEIPQGNATRRPGNFVKTGTLSAGIIAILSGVFLLNQAQTVIEKAERRTSGRRLSHVTSAPSDDSPILTDQVEDRAMAPLPQSEAQSQAIQAESAPTSGHRLLDEVQMAINQMKSAPPTQSGPQPQETPPPPTAPLPEARRANSANPNLRPIFLKIRSAGARLRSGPGEQYSVTGAVFSGQRFEATESVLHSNHRWYKLANNLGWIRNDLVESAIE